MAEQKKVQAKVVSVESDTIAFSGGNMLLVVKKNRFPILSELTESEQVFLALEERNDGIFVIGISRNLILDKPEK